VKVTRRVFTALAAAAGFTQANGALILMTSVPGPKDSQPVPPPYEGTESHVGPNQRSSERFHRISLITAPSNLGLRPNEDGTQQGAWEAPQALMQAGLAITLRPVDSYFLPRPRYEFDAQPGTRIRNGQSIRDFSVDLAAYVAHEIVLGQFPVVIGGDCSVLLGCLYGSRLAGGRGVVHIDGHSDFFHPGNYDTKARLGSAAGMDLALVSGRGEAILTEWPEISGPLARDEEILQMGERDAERPDFRKYYGDILDTKITQWTVQRMLRDGIEPTVREALSILEQRKLDKVWLHIDLDVLDEKVMPAVDSPGKPGLDFQQLSSLVNVFCASRRIVGADFAIYDPGRDPQRRYARPLVECISTGITGSPPDKLAAAH